MVVFEFETKRAEDGEGEGLSFLGGVLLACSGEGDRFRIRLVPLVSLPVPDPAFGDPIIEANASMARPWKEDQEDWVSRLAEGGQGPFERRRRRASIDWVCGESGEESRLEMDWWYSGGTDEVERRVARYGAGVVVVVDIVAGGDTKRTSGIEIGIGTGRYGTR